MNISFIFGLGLTFFFGFLQFAVKEVPYQISLFGIFIGILLIVIAVIIWIYRFFRNPKPPKIAGKENFQEHFMEVKREYPSQSSDAVKATENGAKFYWSATLPNPEYELYYEIKEGKKTFFRHRGAQLWIKKLK